MIERFRPAVAPAYLFLCLLLGGSQQGAWGAAIIQLLAIGLIAWALLEHREAGLARPARQLLALVCLAILLSLIQLVPLPAGMWTTMPGRAFVIDGFRLLGIYPPAMPISLSPYDSLATLLALLPFVGMLAATLVLRAYSALWLAFALIAGTLAGILLGILQVSSPFPEQSSWYLYRVSNFGVATGFFANSNHMANLLLVTIPFVAAVGATLRGRSDDMRTRSAGLAVAFSGLALIILGLILNRSLAGYGLGVPVVLASLLLLFGLPARWTGAALVGIGLAGIAALALLWTSPVSTQLDGLGASTSVTSRRQIAASSLTLASEFAPVGSGLGTFPKLYQLKEDPSSVDRFYVNHAHNDYLELATETGLPGVLLMLAFLLWWGRAVWLMLQSPASDHFALAGAVASAAILMHSLVDYPLRTGAISAVFAASLALILQSRRTAHSDSDLRPVRHLVVG
jgi:O-antigen ligase